MTIPILVFIYRKPGLSMEAFIEHYEKTHMPLLYELAGEHFPVIHCRIYVDSTEPGAVHRGTPEHASYHCMALIEFEDMDHIRRYNKSIAPGQAAIQADEKLFMDVDRSTGVIGKAVNVSVRGKP